MTESQKAFEANYKANHHFWHSSIFAIEDDGSYVEIVMRDHFQNWQAAEAYGRKQALEEAVQICKGICSPFPTDAGNGYNEAALDCEKAIKELIK